MKSLTPYLFFDGNCREAMEFYKSCFGGELELLSYADAPEGSCGDGPTLDNDKIMHACLTNGEFTLMASDNPMGAPLMGDHLSLSINCESMADIQRLYKQLSEDGKMIMPLNNTFWGAHFGMLIDKYEFHWMLNLPLPNAE